MSWNADDVLDLLEEAMMSEEDLLIEQNAGGETGSGTPEKMSVKELKHLAKKRKKHHDITDVKAGKRAARELGKAGRERRAKLAAKTRKRHGR